MNLFTHIFLEIAVLIALVTSLSGCNPPQVDSCITDLNQLDRDLTAAIKSELPGVSVDQLTLDILKAVHASKANYCVPFDSSLPDYFRPINTGDHSFDKANYAVLLKWVVDKVK